LPFPTFSFHKKQRISAKRDIEFLFQHGHSFLYFPFRLIIAEHESADFPLKILISVPKNKLKKAVQRNRIKRVTREAWRLNSQHLILQLQQNNKSIFVGLVFVHEQLVEYSVISKAIHKILQHIENTVQQ
jgi:ribonuclease P protein component